VCQAMGNKAMIVDTWVKSLVKVDPTMQVTGLDQG